MEKKHVDSVIYASTIIPVVPANVVLDNHAIIVHNSRIVDILPRNDVLERYIPTESTDLSHHILIPGLVNSHTHAAMTLLRGLADDKALCEWLVEDIWPAEGKFVSAEFVKDGVMHAVAEMIRSGTTCFNDMYFYAAEECEILEQIGMRGVVGQPVFEFPSSYAANANEYFDKAIPMLEKYKQHDLIRISVSPHAPYTVSESSWKRAVDLAEEYNVPIHVHLHETADECHDSETQNKSSMNCHLSDEKLRPLGNLKRLGFLSQRLIAVHMTQLTDEEIQDVANAGSHVVHCPSSNFKLASGMCRVTDLLKHGVNVAIGTDGAASNNTLNMLGEMRLAALFAKVESNNCTSVPAATALQMATLNGAKAVGLDKDIGSIEIGKCADFVALSCDNIEMLPMYNAISHAVYVASRENVSHVWINGKIVLKEREFVTINEKVVKENVLRWHDKIRDYHDLLLKKKAAKERENSEKIPQSNI